MIEIKNIEEVLPHISEFQGIIFDLDDTLYSEKEYVRSGYRVIAEAYPQIDNMEKKLWRAFLKKKQAIDVVLNAENMISEKDNCIRLYRQHTPQIVLYSGVDGMLKDIMNQKKKLGLITDGRPEGQRAKIKALRLERFFSNIIITDELGGIEYRKPNETAFCIMQKEIDVPFEKMVYIGDNINKDFKAPERLGMGCIWFNNQEGLYSYGI